MSARLVTSYRVLVGLEVHVQLATRSKMFTGAANGFGGEPNSQVDEQVLGLPGVLPVMNKRAVEYAIKVGRALNCQIARHTKWDRKSYYYPDLPKNYQISQYDLPLCYGGHFDLAGNGEGTGGGEGGRGERVRIRRAHLEEDAGKLLHEAPGGYAIDWSIVDLNRAGTPLLEIVTEPDLRSGREVAAFGRELQQLVQYLGVSEGQMQKGHMRFEPNINVHLTDAEGKIHQTAITEIKNLNSFEVLEKATDYEIARQLRQWEETGGLGKKSTHGWDADGKRTYWQRDKEQAHDYRYFPDPDLVPVEVSEAWLGEIAAQIGELPAARRKRYAGALGLSATEAEILASDREAGDFFEQMLAGARERGADLKQARTLMEALRQMSNERGVPLTRLGIAPSRVAEVAALVASGKLAAGKEGAMKVIGAMSVRDDLPAEQAAADLGLTQVSDAAAIDAACDQVIASNPKVVADYKGGKAAALGSLTGQVKKINKGFDAKLVQQRLREKLA